MIKQRLGRARITQDKVSALQTKQARIDQASFIQVCSLYIHVNVQKNIYGSTVCMHCLLSLFLSHLESGIFMCIASTTHTYTLIYLYTYQYFYIRAYIVIGSHEGSMQSQSNVMPIQLFFMAVENIYCIVVYYCLCHKEVGCLAESKWYLEMKARNIIF